MLRWALLCAGLAAGTGCATLRATVSGYATGPNGISRSQQGLRAALAEGDFKKALAWHEDDALLQSLTTGVAAYYAMQFSRSAAVLDTAALLADDRITASLSKDALSLVTNDMARLYQPRRTERLLIPYYAMLSYVQLGEWEDAAVEARRLAALLAQYAEDRDDRERAVHGTMQHLAGAVFERAGERNEAQVAYRAAHALLSSLPERAAGPGAAGRGAAAEGELLVVVERGVVAHRATETIELYLGGDDRDSLRQGGEGRWEPMSFRPSRRHREDDDGYHLTVAYPSLRRTARPWGGAVRLSVDSTSVGGMEVTSVLDDASAVDADRERLALATRAVARAMAKYAVTKAIKDKKGKVAGTLANIGASLLERADVRSWHLLPQEISLLRVRVPAGARRVRLEMGDGWSARSVDVGSVVIRGGELTIVPVRLWRDPPPVLATSAAMPVVAVAESDCTTVVCR